MNSYAIINYSKASQSQLVHYIKRTGWLHLGLAGSFTADMLGHLTSGNYAPVFLRLPDPDTELPEPFLAVLRQYRGLIITSPYPPQLYRNLELEPFDFLTEPFSFDRFAKCMECYVDEFG